MRSGKILLFSMALALISNAFAITISYAALSMAVPTAQESFPAHGPIPSPIISTDPSQAMPIGVGPVATGGATLFLQIGFGLFSGPVDVYVGIYAPSIDPDHVYILMPDNVTLQPMTSSTALTPWVAGTLGNISKSVFGTIPVSALPAGTYSFYLVVTPAGSLDSYYFWTTAIDVTNNVLPVSVNGSLCSAGSYPNKPCVSVTVCTPGTSICQTVNDILLDTGSYGLRIFKQALSVSLPQDTIGFETLAECIQYGDGSSNWGPVQTASVILGNEPAVEVPIQVIDSTFGALPAACQNAEQSPAAAGFNGVLGVGLFVEDCGPACSSGADNGMYYACSGSICSGTTVALSSQVKNPVALLPQDNNGVIIQLPDVPLGGSPSVDGALILGIGTSSNNMPSAVTTYEANLFGEFVTTFDGVPYNSFIDSGTNGLFFASPSSDLLPNCAFLYSQWFCPSSTTSLFATNTGAFGSPSGVVSFHIGNFISLISSANEVFAEIGGNSSFDFEWGLPFFFGRNVYVGLDGRGSSLGNGPYWAY
jgi:hypothetical protein